MYRIEMQQKIEEPKKTANKTVLTMDCLADCEFYESERSEVGP